MKIRILDFFKKYWLCFLLSIIMLIGVFLSTHYADLYEIGSDMIRFNLSVLYMIYIMPIYSLLYGCLSYIKAKKIWVPQLILYLITSMYYFSANLIIDKEIDAWKNILIFSAYPVVFSLIGTAITLFVHTIINSMKKNQD